MRNMAEQKTNAMRILDRAHVAYESLEYAHGKDAVDGVTVASLVGHPVENVFKTLVTRSGKGNIYVFVVPVDHELDLKKAAAAVSEKSIQMIHVNEIHGLTGYIRGGCSPVGMKKRYPTVFHHSIQNLSYILVSAGRIGQQVKLAPEDLLQVTGGMTADIC